MNKKEECACKYVYGLIVLIESTQQVKKKKYKVMLVRQLGIVLSFSLALFPVIVVGESVPSAQIEDTDSVVAPPADVDDVVEDR